MYEARRVPEIPGAAVACRPDQASVVDRIGMASVCRSCGVFERCTAFVAAEQITGGFWAGDFRDRPEAPDVIDEEQPADPEPVAS